MRFTWDENKNIANIAKHRLDFKDAYKIFKAFMMIELDDREDYGETRCHGIGMLDNRLVFVVYTEPDEDTVRIISLRKAYTHERKLYQRSLPDGLGFRGRP